MSYSYRGGAEGWGKKNQNVSPLDPEAEGGVSAENSTRSNGRTTAATSSWKDKIFGIAVLRWVNAAAYVTNAIITYGVGMYGGSFGLSTNSEVSAYYQTLVTPVAWSFAVVWSIIFAAQAAWVLRQFCIKPSRSDGGAAGSNSEEAEDDKSKSATAEKAVKAVGYRYLTAVICQGSWTICFGKEYIIASFVLMMCIWINLLTIVRNLDTLSYDLQASVPSRMKDYVLDVLPFAVHFGWISAAFVVNANVLMESQEVESNGMYGAAIGSLVFIMILAFVLICRSGYLTAPLVLVFALLGIYAELANPQADIVAAFEAEQIDTIRLAAVGTAVVVLLVIIVQATRQYRVYKREQKEEAVHLAKVARGAPVYFRAPY